MLSLKEIAALKKQGLKQCNTCDKILPLDNYHIKQVRKTGTIQYMGACKECSSQKWKMRVYKLTSQELAELADKNCEVCGTTEDLCIDHCHTTGKVRGVLCRHCNTAEGMLRSDYNLAQKLADYIKRTN